MAYSCSTNENAGRNCSPCWGGLPAEHQASPVRLMGAALGVAASIAVFGAMLANPFERSRGFDIQEFGEGYYRAVLATTSVLLFLASGALLLGLIID